MSAETNNDPRDERSAQTDEALHRSHAELDENVSGCGRSIPLCLAFGFAAAAFLAGVYLANFSGKFSPLAYNEEAGDTGGAIAAPKPVDPVVLGKKQYAAACMTCHQPNGLGTPGTYPPLAGSEWVLGSEERLIRIVLHGLAGEVSVAGKTFNNSMPSFGKVPGSGYNWRDDQIAAVLTFIRQEWGNKAGAIQPEKVSEIRTKVQRATPWTSAELLALP